MKEVQKMINELPERYAEFSEARKNGFLKVKDLKDNGGHVAGIFCTFTPVEILDAAGFMPVSLCGMSDETIPAAEAHLPKNLCPLIKSSYGFAVSDKCPYTYFADIIVGETTCDGKKKMYEMLDKIKRTYVLHLPQGNEDYSIEQWTSELRRFAEFLKTEFGVSFTDDDIRKAARVRNEERRARCALMAMQKQHPAPAYGYDLLTALDGSGFMFDPSQRIDKINALREKVMDEYNSGKGKVPCDAKRILVTGCPIGGVLEKTVKAIEQRGGAVVCFENCGGIKAAFQMVDADAGDIYRALAERYLQIGCSVMTPNTKRMELLRELVKEFDIDGVVEVDLQACGPYTVEAYTVRKLMEELEIPFLSVETDYSRSDSGQLSTRLEAFLEMI